MKIEWNKVTRFSATLALILFAALPFFGFWLGRIYGGAKQYERDMLIELKRVSLEPYPTATKIIDYVPTAPETGATVVDGSCWTNSIAAPFRADAWRCTVGNNIQDPCFEIKGNVKTLLCTNDPADPSSSLALTLAKPLPKPGKIPAPASPADGVWLIKLKNGILCSPFTGTLPFSDKGDVARYGCTDKRLIFSINADKKIWTAKVGTLSSDPKIFPPQMTSSSTVPIAAVWK
jgi:hypothetical protein